MERYGAGQTGQRGEVGQGRRGGIEQSKVRGSAGTEREGRLIADC
jgi:hypothetical protein